jgi:cytochrome c oxidase cbb3-type subunit 2
MMKMKILNLFVMTGLMMALAACNQKPEGARQDQIRDSKTPEASGVAHAAQVTFSDFPVPPKPAVTPEFTARGKFLYEQNCSACHGFKGDAKADAAAFLLPKPRNFVEARFRLRSTPSGNLPTDVDLYRAVSLGMPGTPMPPWKHMLSEDDRWAVVEYIKAFSPRFTDPKEDRKTSVALGSPPARNQAAIAEGQALFTKLSCNSCHGESGAGDGPSAPTLVDDSGTKIVPRNFSKPGMFKSGYATKEIVRAILTGFDGTPMVGYHGSVSTDDAWKLAYFVQTLAKPVPTTVTRASQNFLEREQLGDPDVRIKLTERAWKYDPELIRVKKGQIVEITFEPTDNGLGVGHGFAISSYDEVAFINGVMVGGPKSVKFRADRAGKFTFYCSTQCSTDKLHPLMHGTLIVETDSTKQTASLE